jgi:hypothetical protein
MAAARAPRGRTLHRCGPLPPPGRSASYPAGAQAVTWLVTSLVIFLVPYGMLTAELGAAFPVEAARTNGHEWPSAVCPAR